MPRARVHTPDVGASLPDEAPPLLPRLEVEAEDVKGDSEAPATGSPARTVPRGAGVEDQQQQEQQQGAGVVRCHKRVGDNEGIEVGAVEGSVEEGGEWQGPGVGGYLEEDLTYITMGMLEVGGCLKLQVYVCLHARVCACACVCLCVRERVCVWGCACVRICL